MVFLAVTHGPSGWGVAGPQVEGHRFSEDGHPCHSLDRHATRGRLQDRSLSQAGSTRFAIVEGLWNWRLQSPYPIDEDWVFASPPSKGKPPYWPGSLYKADLEPAAKEVGIVGHFGWHAFRHYSDFRTIPG